MAKIIMVFSESSEEKKKEKFNKTQSMGQRLILSDWLYCEIFLQSILKLGAQNPYHTIPAQDCKIRTEEQDLKEEVWYI